MSGAPIRAAELPLLANKEVTFFSCFSGDFSCRSDRNPGPRGSGVSVLFQDQHHPLVVPNVTGKPQFQRLVCCFAPGSAARCVNSTPPASLTVVPIELIQRGATFWALLANRRRWPRAPDSVNCFCWNRHLCARVVVYP